MAPLPFEPASRHHAPGIRSWQLARPLLRAGHRVRLILCRYPEAYQEPLPPVASLALPEGDGEIHRLEPDAFLGSAASELLNAEESDLLVGASAWPADRLASLDGDRPLWVDLLGHTMTEGQAKAVLHRDDDLLLPYFQRELRLLARGDRFSTVSRAQRSAVLGELGLAGRLNASTEEHPFVSVVPCGCFEPDTPSESTASMRGADIPQEAYVVLWSGGFNTWADVPTLVSGLERAMGEWPELHFVSTGGELEGQDHDTYPSFRSAVEASRFRSRFHLLGWVDPARARRCLEDADLGINVDRDIPEAWLGSRNRIATFLSHGLPVVTTPASEVSRDAAEAGVARLFPAGSEASLAEVLLSFRQPEHRIAPDLARRYAETDLYPEVTTGPLLDWAKSPGRAPDAGRTNVLASRLTGLTDRLDAKDRTIAELSQRLDDAERHVANLEGLIADKEKALDELRAFEARVKGSLPYRLYRFLRPGR